MTESATPACLPRSRNSRWTFAVALLLNSLLYFWVAHPQLPLPLDIDPAEEPYNQLADALLAGQTHIKQLPHPELLSLPDPYDPVRNHEKGSDGRVLSLHDMSLFHGRYYVYFGVVPALTVFAPYHWFTGAHLPTCSAGLIFALGALLWTSLMVRLALDQWFSATPRALQLMVFLGAGVCNLIPFLLATAQIYEVAILSGQCFVLGGLYFLARAALSEHFRSGFATLGSLLLGVAVGCRPHLAVVGVVVLGGLLLVLALRERTDTMRRRLARLFWLGAPWSLVIGLLALYNYARFESFTEFGARYALVGNTVHVFNNQLLRVNRVGIDLYCYLFFPPALTEEFPYVQLLEPPPEWLPPDHFGTTPLTGVLMGLPFLRILLIAPIVLLGAWRRRQCDYAGALAALLAAGSATLLFLASFGLTMRYEIDFVGFFLIAAILVALRVDAAVRGAVVGRWMVRGGLLVLLLISCWFSLAISFTGQRSHPCDLARLERWRAFAPRLQAPPEPASTVRRRTTPAVLTSKRAASSSKSSSRMNEGY